MFLFQTMVGLINEVQTTAPHKLHANKTGITPGGRFNISTLSSQCMTFHCKDEIVSLPFYLHNEWKPIPRNTVFYIETGSRLTPSFRSLQFIGSSSVSLKKHYGDCNMADTYWVCPMKDQYNSLLVVSLQWCHNERDGVSNHQPHHWLLSGLFRRRSKNTSKWWNSPLKGPVTRKMFPFYDGIMFCCL